MSQLPESWEPIAKTLGYPDEKSMLVDLYEKEGLSITDLAKKLGYARNSVRRRLLEYGIKPRSRGGLNNLGMSKLRDVSDEDLKHARMTAKKHGVCVSTVFKEAKRRKERECNSAQSPPSPTSSELAGGDNGTSASRMSGSNTPDTQTGTKEEVGSS